MKSRITTKSLVIVALFTLIVNMLTSFGSVFVQAKTTESGYKINVSYQNGVAQLTGDSSDVLQGYKLTGLTDESTGQSYDPNNFSMQVTKNGTYNFKLDYTLNGISNQTQSESVQVVVDKLTSGNSKTVANTDALLVSTLATQATPSVANVPVDLYAYENYTPNSSSDAVLLGKTSIPSGEFSSTQNAINDILQTVDGAKGREYRVITLKRSDNSEVEILGIWKNGDKLYYEPKLDNSGGTTSDPGIAYEVASSDIIRVYCGMNSSNLYSLDKSALNNSMYTNVNIVPIDSSGKIAAGSKVLVNFKWDISIYDVNVKVSYGGKEENLTLTSQYDKNNRIYQGYFTMPSASATLKVSPTKKSSRRWIGVYDSASLSFQKYEVGGTRLSVDTDPYPGQGHETRAYSQVYRSYPLTQQGWGKLPIVNFPDVYIDNQDIVSFTQSVYSTDSSLYPTLNGNFAQNSTDLISGYSQPGGGTSISYPIQDYQAGTPIVINYETMRGVATSVMGKTSWWRNYKGETGTQFVYLPATTGNIDVFPSQQYQSSTQDEYQKNFQRFTFRTYQSESEYNADPDKNEYMGQYWNGTPVNGMYPVSTTLPNGIKITSYPISFEAQSGFNTSRTVEHGIPNPEVSYLYKEETYTGYDGKGLTDNDLVLPRIKFKIKIENAWDDVRVSIGLGSSTIQESQQLTKSSGISELFTRGDTNSNQEYQMESNNKLSNLVDGSSSYPIQAQYRPIINGTSTAYHYYKIKPKLGYSVPIPTRTIRISQIDNSSTQIVQVDGSQPSNVVSTGTNVNTIGNKFVAGRFAGKNNNGMAISQKPFYEDGYYYYSILADKSAGTESQLTFKSEPVNFDVIFKNFTSSGDYKPSNSKYNVETQRYFSVPNRLPTSNNGGFFKGWDLKVSGDGIQNGSVSIKTGSYEGGLYAPGDIVDIAQIYEALKPYLNAGAIGKNSYTITFEPNFEGTSNLVGKVTFSLYYQNSTASGDQKYQKQTSVTQQVLRKSSFQVTGVSEIKENKGITYRQNPSTSSQSFITFDAQTGEYHFYYDKGINVKYSLGAGTGKVEEDNNIYTTVDGNSNIITTSNGSGVIGSNSKKFVGWKLQAGNQVGTQVYAPGSKVDLATQPDALKQAIFNAGSVTLVAQYEAEVSQIKKADNTTVGGDTSKQMNDSWVYDGKNFTITGTFKYGDITTTPTADQQAAYKNAVNNKKIYYALYKQNPNNGVASTNSYSLWKSTLTDTNQSSKVESVTYSDKLDNSGNFTITVTLKNVVENGSNSISYKWDNNARYRIYSWSAANNVSGNFGTNGYANSSLSYDVNTPNLPSYTNQIRVLEPFKITGVSNNLISSKKLMYSTEKASISFEFTTNSGETLTKNELTNETSIVLAKIEPNGGSPKVWYVKSKGTTGWYNGFTNEAGGWNPKAASPTLSISGGADSGNKFTLTINNISDTLSGSLAKWASNAHYIAYVWNSANSTPPKFDSSSSSNLIKYTINNQDQIDVPRYDLNPHIIDGSSSSTEKNTGKAYNGIITYPTSARLEKKTDGKVKSSMLSIKLHGVWSNSNGTPGQEFDPTDATIQHDYLYVVGIKTAGTTIVDKDSTKIKLSQNITNGHSFVANVLKDGKTQLSDGVLGTLNFAANGTPVTSLDFQVIGDSPGLSSKDEFSGTMEYQFTQQKVNKE